MFFCGTVSFLRQYFIELLCLSGFAAFPSSYAAAPLFSLFLSHWLPSSGAIFSFPLTFSPRYLLTLLLITLFYSPLSLTLSITVHSLSCRFLGPYFTVSCLLLPTFFLGKINSFPSFLLSSLHLYDCWCASCPSACRPSTVHPALLLQLSVSPSAYDSQSSDELSSNQSMSFSPSKSAQPIPCFDSGPSPAHPSPGGARQVSVETWRGYCL